MNRLFIFIMLFVISSKAAVISPNSGLIKSVDGTYFYVTNGQLKLVTSPPPPPPPGVAGNFIESLNGNGTNTTFKGPITLNGPIVSLTKAITLSLGTNYIQVWSNGVFILTSPTNNASLVTVGFHGGTNTVQYVTIVNGATNKAFTVYANSTNTIGGGLVMPQGDWITTNYLEAIDFVFYSPYWVEKGRTKAFTPSFNTINYLPAYAGGGVWADSPAFKVDATTLGLGPSVITFTNNGKLFQIKTSAQGVGTIVTDTSPILIQYGGSDTTISDGTRMWSFSNANLYGNLSNTMVIGLDANPLAKVIIATNSGSGLVLGTNIISDNGTSVTRNGSAIGSSGANPSQSVSLAAVNGSASTFLRSDGAPALDQSIAPTWTGRHIFGANSAVSAPAFSSTGSVYYGGSATTTKPSHLIEVAGTTSTGWSTAGTLFGVNSPSNAMVIADFQVAGVSDHQFNHSNARFSMGNGTPIVYMQGSSSTAPALALAQGSFFGWSSANNGDGTADIFLKRISAGIMGLRTNMVAVGSVTATNGFASYATTQSVSVGSLGITNTLSANYRVMGFVGVSVVHSNSALATQFSRGTLTAPTDIILQPNESLFGTSCSASGVQLF